MATKIKVPAGHFYVYTILGRTAIARAQDKTHGFVAEVNDPEEYFWLSGTIKLVTVSKGPYRGITVESGLYDYRS